MPLPLPDLDTRRFDDLVAEMRAMIPQLAPEWTNHNASDPGIALMELVAWVVEANLYRANRIPARSVVNFVSLLLGETSVEAVKGVEVGAMERAARDASPEVDEVFVRHAPPAGDGDAGTVRVTVLLRPGASRPRDTLAAVHAAVAGLWVKGPEVTVELLGDAKQRALRFFNEPYRAITVADFEREAKLASERVRRVAVVPYAELGTVEMVVVADAAAVEEDVLSLVLQRLDRRKLVGTHVVVRPPRRTDVDLAVRLALRPDGKELAPAVPPAQERRPKGLAAAEAALRAFLDPVVGGPEGEGWPFGRPVSVFELYRLLEAVPGVDHVASLVLDGEAARLETPVEDLPRLATLALQEEPGT